MADATIHGIEFEIKGNASSAADSLNKLATSLSKIKNITSQGIGFGAMAKELRSFSKAMESTNLTSVALFVSALKKIASVHISGNFARGLSKLGASLSGIKTGGLTKLADSLTAIANLSGKDFDFEKIASGVRSLGEATKELASSKYSLGDPSHKWASDMTAMVESQDKGFLANLREVTDSAGLTRFADESDKVSSSLKDTGAAAASAATSVSAVADSSSEASSAASEAAPAFNAFGTALKTIQKTAMFVGKAILLPFKTFGKGLLPIIESPVTETIKRVKVFGGAIKTLAQRLGRIAMYRVFRTIIKAITQALQEGTKNLYQYSKAVGTTFAQNMDRAATAMQYFKNSVAAAWSPLMGILAPALDAIVDKVVDVINAINQLIALLSGASGWTRAVRQATEYEEAVGGAGGAAKEALKYLAPFDELNVLPDEKSGGGGGGGADYVGMFEEMESFEEGIAGFAEKIREAIENGKWEDLGKLIGEKINSLFGENGIINFSEIGTKVGQKINALFTTQYWTLDTINFQEIGASVARFLTNALSSIDFTIIGRTFSQRFTNIFDIVIGFINEMDFGELGKAVSNWILGALTELTEWIKEVDWSEFMHNLVQGIIDFISNMQIGKILVAVSDLFVAVSSAVFDLTSALIQDTIDIIKNPSFWELLWAWFYDYVVRGAADLGIRVVNAFQGSFSEAINRFVAWWNDSEFVDWLEENLHIEGMTWELPEWEVKIIPELDPPIGDLYKQKKAEIEAESADNPMGLHMQGVIEEIQSSVPPTETVDVTGRLTALNQSTLRERDRLVDTSAHLVSIDGSSLTRGQRQVATVSLFKWVDGSALAMRDRLIATVSYFKDSVNALSAEQRTLPTTSLFKWVDRSQLSSRQRTIEVTGLYKLVEKSYLSQAQKTIETIGKYVGVNFGFLTTADRTIDATAKFRGTEIAQEIKDPWGRIRIAATADIRGVTGQTTITMIPQADGGAYFGNAWHSIPQFASGGKPHGSLFLAGEAGAEIVGNVGNRTEVLNRSQIASSIYSAVRSAMSGLSFRVESASCASEDAASEEVMYRAFSRALADSDLGGDVNIDGNALYRAMVTRNRQNTRLTGVNAMA